MPTHRRSVINRLAMMAVAATLLSCSALALPTAATAAYRETTAVSWGPGTHLRVYVSDGSNIIERAFDGNGPWYNGGFKQANGLDGPLASYPR